MLCNSCISLLQKVPSRCFRCGTLTRDFRTCPSCRHQTALFQVWPATLYDDTAKTAVHRLKFERAQAIGHDLAKAMVAAMPPGFCPDLITHVPTATSRIRRRGYDQAQVIAKEVARLLQCPHASLLARTDQHRQVGQSGVTRREQLRQSFRPLQSTKAAHRTILLIDDVLTTGSTLSACAEVLKTSGAKRISAAVFAQA
jgi:ComF family protein